MSKRKKPPAEKPEISQPEIQRSPGFSTRFKEDLAWWFKTDFKKASKILDLVTVVMQDPFEGIGKPEPLKYLNANTWSRRIDLEHWFVHQVEEAQINFLSCRYHYED